jgi:hypothetical protein
MYRVVSFYSLKKDHSYFIQSNTMQSCGTFYAYDDEEKLYALFCKKAKEDLYLLYLVRKDEKIYIQSIIPSIQQAMEQRALQTILKHITGDESFKWLE